MLCKKQNPDFYPSPLSFQLSKLVIVLRRHRFETFQIKHSERKNQPVDNFKTDIFHHYRHPDEEGKMFTLPYYIKNIIRYKNYIFV